MSDVGELAELPIPSEEGEPLDDQTLEAFELLPQHVFVDLRVAEPSDQRRPVVVQRLELLPERGRGKGEVSRQAG